MDMTDRWRDRADPPPGQARLYWHVLMRDQPQVRALAALARQRLAPYPGLHLTPEERLHMTILRAGTSPDLPQEGIEAMVGRARELLRPVPAATVTIGQVLYHPEAIALSAVPDGALDPLATAIRQAAASAAGGPATPPARRGVRTSPSPTARWTSPPSRSSTRSALSCRPARSRWTPFISSRSTDPSESGTGSSWPRSG